MKRAELVHGVGIIGDTSALASIVFDDALARPDRDPIRVYVTGRQSKRSRETMFEALNRVSRLPGLHHKGGIEQIVWSEFTYAHAQALRSALHQAVDEHGAAKYSPATVNVTLVALRGVLETAMNLELMSFEQCYRAKQGLKSVQGTRLPPGRDLTEVEIATLLVHCASIPGTYGAMLRGLIAVLLGAGLRREEVCRLRLDNYARPELTRVLGKGNKQRDVPLSNRAIVDLEAWIEIRKTLDLSLPWMFLRVRKDQIVEPRSISLDALYNLVRDLGAELGFGHISTHDLRRTCATRQLDRGVSVLIVQRNLGHQSSKTTEKYDRRGLKEAKAAIDLAGVY